jgi:hypothetical protein
MSQHRIMLFLNRHKGKKYSTKQLTNYLNRGNISFKLNKLHRWKMVKRDYVKTGNGYEYVYWV